MMKIPFLTIIFFVVVGCVSLYASEAGPDERPKLQQKKEKIENKLRQKTFHPFHWEEVNKK